MMEPTLEQLLNLKTQANRQAFYESRLQRIAARSGRQQFSAKKLRFDADLGMNLMADEQGNILAVDTHTSGSLRKGRICSLYKPSLGRANIDGIP